MDRRRFSLAAFSALVASAFAGKPWKGNEKMNGKVFPCSGAGRWFPADKEELRETVDGFLDRAQSVSAHPLAVIAPHAGYPYSGAGAGESYKVFAGRKLKRVVVLGLSHYAAFRGVSVLSGYEYYNTPLGDIRINQEGCAFLLSRKHFSYRREAHAPEHSLENQLPFIQRVLPQAEIVPCIVGELDGTGFREAGASVAGLMDGDTAMAVSSDFTHYGASFGYEPFTGDFRKNLEKLDKGAIDAIVKTDFEAFAGYLDRTGATICGRNPISLMICALKGKARGRLLKYYTSSDDTGDFSHAVCYASVLMERA